LASKTFPLNFGRGKRLQRGKWVGLEGGNWRREKRLFKSDVVVVAATI